MSAKSTDIKNLQAAVRDMDSVAREGLSEIAAIAKLALSAMESPTDYPAQETIAKIFSAIWSKAENIESCIYAESESVGAPAPANRRCVAWMPSLPHKRERDMGTVVEFKRPEAAKKPKFEVRAILIETFDEVTHYLADPNLSHSDLVGYLNYWRAQWKLGPLWERREN